MAPALCRSCQAPLSVEVRFCPQCGVGAPSVASSDGDPLRTALEREVAGRYRVERLLGRGGMGAVYLALETSLDREVAIKVLPPGREAGAGERFRREAKMAARLAHPGIVPLFTFGEAPDLLYFVMGYVEGESLAQKVRREGRVDSPSALRLLTEVAEALQYAHGEKVIHRDIKVDNILVEAGSGRAVLADFGLAKGTEAGREPGLTGAGFIVGTPGYMSPEQARGDEAIDGRSDVYSLGVVAFVLLAGRLPFEGRSAHEVMRQHISAAPPSVRDFNPDLPKSFDAVLKRCLSKNPADRYPTATEFVTALRDTSPVGSWFRRVLTQASRRRDDSPDELARPTPSALPSAPAEFLPALEEAWKRVAGPPWDVVEPPLRRLVSAAERADARAQRLGRDADIADVRRLEKRIAGLAPEADDPPERAELRQLLEGQLRATHDLMRSVDRDRASKQAAIATLRSIFVAAQKAAARGEVVSSAALDGLLAGTPHASPDGFDSQAATRAAVDEAQATALRTKP